MYTASIVRIDNISPHPNAEKLNLTMIHGNQVIIGLDTKIDDIGVFFPEGGQLSEDFCHFNNLYSESPKNLDRNIKGYFDKNRRIRALTLRGEKSEGFWLPISCLNYVQTTEALPELGQDFTHIGSIEVCRKYVTPATFPTRGDKGTKHRMSELVMFPQHFETSHFGKNIHKFEQGDIAYITTKLHGTSQRVGNVLVPRKLTWKDKIAKWFGVPVVTEEWSFVIGTRRVNLNIEKQKGFRELAAQPFMNKLHKGELVYYEVVGYDNETPVMGSHSNAKMKNFLDKSAYDAFIAKFGTTTVFSYNCKPGELDVYVYRIANINEDGVIVDLPWEAVITRCKELGVKHVPERAKIVVGENLEEIVKRFNSPHDPLFTNISEGVCVRKDSYPTPLIVKEKTFEFKVLEGIIKDNDAFIDKEEVEDATN